MYAAEAFSNLGEAAGAPQLIQALAPDRDSSTRMYAVWTLARLGDRRGRPVLEDLLEHGELHVRLQAAWTMGEMQEPTPSPSLRRAVFDEAPPVRWQAAWALARQYDKGLSGS